MTAPKPASWFGKRIEEYRRDHKHPVNGFLHVFVGWPLVAAAVLTAAFRPYWAVALFVAGYAFMFAGHFLFEKNVPTILKHPATPFLIAWAVIRGLFGVIARPFSRVGQ